MEAAWSEFLKAFAVPPFLVEITVGPRSLSFALLHACRYDPVIWSRAAETLSGRLYVPVVAEEGGEPEFQRSPP